MTSSVLQYYECVYVYACIIGHILLSVCALYTLVLAASNLWDCTIEAERDNYIIFNKNGNVLRA